jgi:hypothetical protein
VIDGQAIEPAVLVFDVVAFSAPHTVGENPTVAD